MPDQGPVSLPPFVVTVRPVSNVALQMEVIRQAMLMTWNPAQNTFDVNPGEITVEIVPVGQAPLAPDISPESIPQNYIEETTQSWWIGDTLVLQKTFVAPDGALYSGNVRIGPNTEQYFQRPDGIWKVRPPGTEGWSTHEGAIPPTYGGNSGPDGGSQH